MTSTPNRQSIFTPVWRSAIDPAAVQAQTAEWDANPPASSPDDFDSDGFRIGAFGADGHTLPDPHPSGWASQGFEDGLPVVR